MCEHNSPGGWKCVIKEVIIPSSSITLTVITKSRETKAKKEALFLGDLIDYTAEVILYSNFPTLLSS